MLPRWTAVILIALLACGCSWCSLTFTPDELTPAVKGRPYRARVTISSNDTPVGGIQLESGKLPPGLHLHRPDRADHAIISGTPTTAGTYEFVIGAWCFGTMFAGQSDQHQYVLTVK